MTFRDQISDAVALAGRALAYMEAEPGPPTPAAVEQYALLHLVDAALAVARKTEVAADRHAMLVLARDGLTEVVDSIRAGT